MLCVETNNMVQCVFVCIVRHLFTWYANEIYAYAIRDIFFLLFYNIVIVMNLLLYIRKCEGKW